MKYLCRIKWFAALLCACAVLLVPAVIVAEDVPLRYGDTLDYSFDTRLGVLTIYGSGKMNDWSETDASWRHLLSGQTLRKVVIKEGVTSIGNYAFSQCDTLEAVEIADTVTSIGESAFSNCEKLTKVKLPSALKRVGENAFYDCRYAEFNALPQNLATIEAMAFVGCDRLSKVEIPASVTEIGVAAFANCSNLNSITVDAGNRNFTVENGILYNIDKTKLLQAPCMLAGVVSIPEGVTEICNLAFQNCYRLSAVTLPSSMETINRCAFDGCGGIREVTVPASVSFVGAGAFSNCARLERILVDTENAAYMSKDGVLYNKEGSLLLQFPGAFSGDYSVPDGVTEIATWAFEGCGRLNKVVLPDSLHTLGKYVFEGCSNLSSVNISAAVESIPTCTFRGCSRLAQIVIPKAVTQIGERAFQECKSLKQITFEEGSALLDIGYRTFQGCISLQSIDLPDSVKFLGRGAFDGCTALESAKLSQSLSNIPDTCFYNCEKLKEIRIPSGVIGIGAVAFSDCLSLEAVTIPRAVTFIDDFAFFGCSELGNVTIENDDVSIGDYVFYGCGKKLTLHGKADGNIKQYAKAHDYNFEVQYIKPQTLSGACGENLRYELDTVTGVLTVSGHGSMQNWSSNASPWSYSADIKTVLLEDGVTGIGNYAFEGCSDMISVTIPDSVLTIGNCAFVGCTGLQKVSIPSKVIEIGTDAFARCNSALTLYGEAGGAAAAYAEKNGVRFAVAISIDEAFRPKRTYANEFSDVSADQWFAPCVKTAYEYGLANGTSKTKFTPSGTFTVAAALTAAANIHSIYYGKTIATAGAKNWYDPYVDYCIANGMIKEGQFADYNAAITRGNMAIVFAGVLPESTYGELCTGENPDVTSDMPCYAAVRKLYKAGIVGGDAGTGRYRPGENINRAEACVIFTRLATTQFRIGASK